MIADALAQEFHARPTRNAVIGKIHRLGIAAGERKPTVRKPASPPPRKQARYWRHQDHPKIAPWTLEQAPQPPRTAGATLMERDPGGCCYPVAGAGIKTLFCNAKRYEYGGDGIKHTRMSYCWYHCNIMYRFQKPKDKAA